ncbi:LLM class flavin-dependent oxidoreductase [Myxococcus sp. RHSTA-1-4]|uniref:LLM class flavin-dependent oxidoreductase n=1 Tax=Myxococcus sp. RHSTA-1-4 TaxID=2874601 RepID=UPI001CBB7C48|nr:LLM class flavin-dependent oxidoreductase [Myxococcus sp. RHSTA-1-4]MBZ4420712.1 LLM class flavin-dependent oxidoreductase [Myxococcus sp. RHSTA-1-4]
MIPFSVLDLSPITQGSDASRALRNTLDLARHAERWGYKRYWLAEHHNMTGIASAATSVVICHVAGGTSTIRVGAGGIMLPNHAPLVIAEQFGTLEALFPGRIDLGLGRAPGTDPRTARALRRDLASSSESFPQDVLELQGYFEPATPHQAIRAVPGAGLKVPLWLLGSSLFSAQLAAMLGLPFAFASHFAPGHMMQALQLYRSNFKPSESLQRPYAMLGIGVIAADTDAEARRLATSLQIQFLNLQRGTPGQLQPPVDSMDGHWSEHERLSVEHTMSCYAIGSPATVRRELESIIARTGADELMVTAHVYDHAARLRSFEITSQVHDAMAMEGAFQRPATTEATR